MKKLLIFSAILPVLFMACAEEQFTRKDLERMNDR